MGKTLFGRLTLKHRSLMVQSRYVSVGGGAKRGTPWRWTYTRTARGGIPVPRQGHPGHGLRAHLHAAKEINLSTVMAGQRFGVKEAGDGMWLVSFMTHDLG